MIPSITGNSTTPENAFMTVKQHIRQGIGEKYPLQQAGFFSLFRYFRIKNEVILKFLLN